MRIKSLRIFVLIMQEGTLAKASDRLNLSQPAASRLLGLLEEDLGGVLFFRHKSRLVPTPESEKFYPEAIRALKMFDSIPERYREIQLGKTRPLRIVTHSRLIHSLVIPTIATVTKHNPEVRIHLDMLKVGRPIAGLVQPFFVTHDLFYPTCHL